MVTPKVLWLGEKAGQPTDRENEKSMAAYLSIISFFHAVQALAGQTPPIWPSGAGMLMGSELG